MSAGLGVCQGLSGTDVVNQPEPRICLIRELLGQSTSAASEPFAARGWDDIHGFRPASLPLLARRVLTDERLDAVDECGGRLCCQALLSGAPGASDVDAVAAW